ncbi:hypothetical protein ACFVWZ_03550 [Streptomyces sp. NPDC058200]|uniref:hypothetical protein n=1 Tax=Streptomyces sp. NPDC058200 TaxID=3346378 RepID=UPI0036E2C94A
MAWTQPQLAITLPLVLLAVVAAGCADPADDPRAGGPGPPPASAVSKGDCPPPEERRATPSPCITLTDGGTTEDGLRTAAAHALEMRPEQIETRGDDFAPLRDVLVEVVGRTADGACLPAVGGH